MWEPHAVPFKIQGRLFIEMMAAVGPAENLKNQTFHALKIPRQQQWNQTFHALKIPRQQQWHLARTGRRGGSEGAPWTQDLIIFDESFLDAAGQMWPGRLRGWLCQNGGLFLLETRLAHGIMDLQFVCHLHGSSFKKWAPMNWFYVASSLLVGAGLTSTGSEMLCFFCAAWTWQRRRWM